MKRTLLVLAIVVSVVAIVMVTLLPPGTKRTAPPPPTTLRGAFHIHSDRSDGSGSVDAIAQAASRAGLQFIILTDHGDGTRASDAPAYRSGVLTIDGIELNTTGGHYAAIDLPASEYPIAGSPEDVIEDVHRLGGFGIAAHPGSPRPSLSWQAWDAAFDGIEWLNGDSEWRDEPRMPLARALFTYPIRAPQSLATLLDRPQDVLTRWDALAINRKVVGLAGVDAHARLGFRQRTDPDTSSFHVPLPGYEAAFRALSNHVVLDAPLSGDAAQDARVLSGAIRAGHLYSVIDALATPGSLSFTATSGSQSAGIGDALVIEDDVLLHASANQPPGTTLVLLRNGQRVHEVTNGPLEMNGGRDPAVYRIEAYTSGAPGGPAVPWIVSNPIYAGLNSKPRTSPISPAPSSRIPARTAEAATESGPNDVSRIDVGPPDDSRARTFAGDPAINWSFALSPGAAVGQFAAVPIPVSPGLDAFGAVQFRVSSPRPIRVWAQLRAPVGNTERWGATFYADSEVRTITIPFAKFRPIGVTSSVQAPLAQVQFLLFVVDTLNSLPGSKGQITISEVGFVK
jgi:hypothetical protein